MKAFFKLSVYASIIILIAIGCKKIISNENSSDSGNEFNTVFIKEWYYGTFKKSAEWKSSALHGKKLPDWKNGIYHKVGNMEIVEFPLNKAITKMGIPSNNTLSSAERQRLANASLARVLFIKNSKGNISVREIDYIPDWEYLQSKQFDISKVSYGKRGDDFTGKMVVKNWGGAVLSLKLLNNGKITHSGKIKNKGATNTSNLEGCTTYEFCIWQQDCVITIIGDASETVCGEWYNTGDCWTEEYCNEDPCGNMTEEECACQMFGNCEVENPECSLSQEEAIATLNAITSEVINSTSSEDGGESEPDANGIIRKAKVCQGVSLKLHYWGSYYPVWSTTYVGNVYKTTSNSTWKWEVFSFDGIKRTGGDMAPCMSGTTTSTVAVAIDGNELSASGIGNFSVTATCYCLFGTEASSPWNVTVNETFNSN